jgi:hypothetical protein
LVEAASTAEERLAAYEVATALLLKRSLRNGAASSVDSIKHRSLSDQLMPSAQWLKHKGSFARAQALPKTLEGYLGDYKATLTAQVTALDAAITAGDIGLREDRLRIPKLKALGEGPEVRATRDRRGSTARYFDRDRCPYPFLMDPLGAAACQHDGADTGLLCPAGIGHDAERGQRQPDGCGRQR